MTKVLSGGVHQWHLKAAAQEHTSSTVRNISQCLSMARIVYHSYYLFLFRMHFTIYHLLLLAVLCICGGGGGAGGGIFVGAESLATENMTQQERETLREEARSMFYHAYNAYMDLAYPADELMPLSCKGRYRGVTPSRGDMDDILGK